MAISIDQATRVITVPQADCTFVSGSFYRLPTKTVFKAQVDAVMDNEEHIWLPHPIDHNTEYTVAGVTYAPKIEVVNGYTVQFTPDSLWSVELTESNNNLWDVGNGVLTQNSVQVIPTNAAGLQIVSTGSGLSTEQNDWLSDTNSKVNANLHNIEDTGAVNMNHAMMTRIIYAMLCNKVVDAETSTVKFLTADGVDTRIQMDTDEHGNRDNIIWKMTP